MTARRRIICRHCGRDISVTKAGKIYRHSYIITPYWIREWCPLSGTISRRSVPA